MQALNCRPADHLAAIAKLQADRKVLAKQVKVLLEESAGRLGAELADEALHQACSHRCQPLAVCKPQ